MAPYLDDGDVVVVYHPDPAIAAELSRDTIAAEASDLAIGYQPRFWTCLCGATHGRGHLGAIGTHRCLRCGYIGTEGVMHGTMPDEPPRGDRL